MATETVPSYSAASFRWQRTSAWLSVGDALRDRNVKFEVLEGSHTTPSAGLETSRQPQELQFDWMTIALADRTRHHYQRMQPYCWLTVESENV